MERPSRLRTQAFMTTAGVKSWHPRSKRTQPWQDLWRPCAARASAGATQCPNVLKPRKEQALQNCMLCHKHPRCPVSLRKTSSWALGLKWPRNAAPWSAVKPSASGSAGPAGRVAFTAPTQHATQGNIPALGKDRVGKTPPFATNAVRFAQDRHANEFSGSVGPVKSARDSSVATT